MAAGSISTTFIKNPDRRQRPVRRIDVDWTSDASGDVNGIKLPHVSGRLMRIVTKPDGSDTPTDQYDVTLDDEEGIDVLNGNGANRSNSSNEEIEQDVAVDNQLELVVTNAGNAKKGTVSLYLYQGAG